MRRFAAEDINRKTSSKYQPAAPIIGDILVVACQHGDEQFGLEVRDMIETNTMFEGLVDTVVANPRAVRKNVRRTDFNLNRAYDDPRGIKNNGVQTQEHRQAIRVKAISDQYRYVIDVHQGTLRSINGLIIAAELNEPTREIINGYCEQSRVAVFAEHIAREGLIGNLNQGRVSVEYSRDKKDLQEALDYTYVALLRLITSGIEQPRRRQIYLVDQVVPRSVQIDPLVDYNFCPLPNGIGYGVLFGDPAYANEPYHGFAASEVYEEYV